ncbi:MAG: C4-dicarboxylate ABC transporter [Deltaproteobacteria bacterium HGW-Deltaproteobacteria-15]|nr:MAG: C4-dicarboxylate ABC transporter [Deltaproteobacteria bacterium HGW-Deltaproteobacteria-15]
MRREALFGLVMMAIVVGLIFYILPAPSQMTNGHLGLLMLALIVVAIMLGFPTAFTLMGLGTTFTFFAYYSQNPATALNQTLDLMALRAYWVMSNDVLISVPLFVFMGYLVERSNLIGRLFKGLHLATASIPGSLAVATIITCAIFATASGIIGAVVTVMGLLAFPAMLKAGYGIRLAAGAVTAGGTLGIMIPPSVLLILYGATAGVSVVQLYAGAFFPGLMLAGLYVLYVIACAKIWPDSAPRLSEEDRRVDLPKFAEIISRTKTRNVLAGLLLALKGKRNKDVPMRTLLTHLFIALLPALATALLMGSLYLTATEPEEVVPETLQAMGIAATVETRIEGGLEEPEGSETEEAQPAEAVQAEQGSAAGEEVKPGERRPIPTWWWITLAIFLFILLIIYAVLTFVRLEIFKMLLTSFFPLALIILGVLGTIVVGLATPAEAAAMGAFGGLVLAVLYRALNWRVLKEAVFLCAKTSAMVCWLFVGSGIFAAAFALLGGQEIVDTWVKSMDLTPIQFMILAQIIIFLLGWPLEWTEIIVIFMPIFIPLLGHFDINPLFFGLLVALNLQTAFLSPPVAMAAFYLKGVSPPHVTLNQIFLGMMPYMAIQIFAIFLLYMFPGIGLWLPSLVYK